MTLETVAWHELGTVAPSDLASARIALHGAVQLVASFGQAHVEARPDYSQRSMTWNARESAFFSEATDAEDPLRVTVRLRDVTASIRAGDAVVAERELGGGTLEDAYQWLEDELEGVQGKPRVQLGRPDNVILTDPLAGGLSPEETEGPFHELEVWFANSDAILSRARFLQPDATPVRCWPHHFDIATLVTIDPLLGAEDGPSIGVGMSPGDEGYPSPYFYVTPYPYPEAIDLAELPSGGHWHREGWVGAVLPAEALIAAGGSERQREACWTFLTTAMKASRTLLAR